MLPVEKALGSVCCCLCCFSAGGSGYNPITGEPFDKTAQVRYVTISSVPCRDVTVLLLALL